MTDAGEHRLELEGVVVAWRAYGPPDAPPLVLVHSLGLDGRMWAPQVEALAGVRRIVAPDLRGHGRSDAPPGPYSMRRLALDVLAVAETAGLERFDLCGLSIGGQVAQLLALEHPSRLGSLVLADTAARLGSPGAWADRIAAVEAGGMAAVEQAVLERWFAPGIEARQPELHSYARERLRSTSPAGYAGCCAALAASDLRDRVGSIGVPTLVIVGSEDGPTPVAEAQQLHKAIDGSRLEVIEGAGHIANLDRPAAFNGALRDFLGFS